MQIYSQRDPRWATNKLGSTQLTIGRFGCTTTCIAMLSTYFLPPHDPASMARKIQFTPQGLILWGSCVFENFEFYHRAFVRDDIDIREHLKDPNLAVILEVADHSHWVLPVSWNVLLRDYKMADPWTGTYDYLLKKYGNITGAAYFRRK